MIHGPTADECFFGSVTVGERGQVVIPSEVRKCLNIEAGDRLLVFKHPLAHSLVLTKLESVNEVISHFQRALQAFEEAAVDGDQEKTAKDQ